MVRWHFRLFELGDKSKNRNAVRSRKRAPRVKRLPPIQPYQDEAYRVYAPWGGSSVFEIGRRRSAEYNAQADL